MPDIFTFMAKCARCKTHSARPELGEFAYGEFILTGESGNVHAYLHATDNPVFALVASTIEDDSGSLIQEITARLADPLSGQRLTMLHVCPKCGCDEWESWHGDRVASENVPVASFTEFLSLSPERRRMRILELKDELKPSP
jgi:hypothetical protein